MRLRPPSIPAVLFIVIAILVPILLQQPLLNADGDAARHLRHGLFMLEHGSLIRADPFSFTRPGAPFLGFEYGSQLALGLAYLAGGLPGVAILCGLLIATTYALLARFLLRSGVEPLLAYLAAVAAAALGAGHWVARPHLFSFLGVVVLLGMLERPRPLPAWLFAVLFAIWANLHGGFVFGWTLMGAYLAGSVAECLQRPTRDAWRARAQYQGAALVCALVGTLANPYGLALHRHVLGFFGNRYIMDNTAEFVSPDFHEIDGRVYLVGILLMVVVLTASRSRPTLPRLFVMLMTLAFGLMSVRNVALFGLTAIPLLALHADPLWRTLPDLRGFRARFGATAVRTSTWWWIAPVALLSLALALRHGRVGHTQLIATEFDASTFPTAAVAHARGANLHGRIFSEFAWGGYLIYAWPEQRVFIDGGTDFYGNELFRDYSRVKRLAPGWRGVLSRWEIDMALLRPESALAHELSRDAHWGIWHCDRVAVLLRRVTNGGTLMDDAASDAREQELVNCSGATVRAADSRSP